MGNQPNFFYMDIRNLDEEFDRVFGVNAVEKLGYYEKNVRIPCKSIICRFNVDNGCNKSVAYHPIFIEGKCLSFQFDS